MKMAQHHLQECPRRFEFPHQNTHSCRLDGRPEVRLA
jgi:hypothetical protein